ncbi:MAG: DUF3429 domain-containing protein [Burkholderiales bacterium]|nr:DUF3429 domain-containing protein [Nitrosomonadaceae bacterium]
MINPARTASILTYAGAIPFVVCATVLVFARPLGLIEYRPFALQALTTYAAIIVSFLGGIQWGIGVATESEQPQTANSLFLLSVVPSLLAWALLFLPSNTSKVIVALFLVGLVWIVDALLHLQQVIPAWFFRLRCVISAVVMISLTVAMLAA